MTSVYILFTYKYKTQIVERNCEKACFDVIMKFFGLFVIYPEPKSAGCQIGTFKEFFKNRKTKWPPSIFSFSIRGNIFTPNELTCTILVPCFLGQGNR